MIYYLSDSIFLSVATKRPGKNRIRIRNETTYGSWIRNLGLNQMIRIQKNYLQIHNSEFSRWLMKKGNKCLAAFVCYDKREGERANMEECR